MGCGSSSIKTNEIIYAVKESKKSFKENSEVCMDKLPAIKNESEDLKCKTTVELPKVQIDKPKEMNEDDDELGDILYELSAVPKKRGKKGINSLDTGSDLRSSTSLKRSLSDINKLGFEKCIFEPFLDYDNEIKDDKDFNVSFNVNSEFINNSKIEDSMISHISPKYKSFNNHTSFTNFGSAKKLNQTDRNFSKNTINVSASKYESMHPIWVEKGKVVNFEVNGVWRKDPSEDYVDYKGYPLSTLANPSVSFCTDDINTNGVTNDTSTSSFNEGELLCRVLGDTYFSVKNNLEYMPKDSGPIFFKMYISNTSGKKKIAPKGQLIVSISNSEKMSFEQIDERLGWNISLLDTTTHIPNLVINSTEKNLIILLNKLRSNSYLFAEQYLENIKNLGSFTNKLYDILKNSNVDNISELYPLKVNKKLFHFFKSLLLSNPKENEKRVKDYLKNFKLVQYFSIQNNDSNALALLLKLMMYDDVRKAVFSTNSEVVSVQITPVSTPGMHVSNILDQSRISSANNSNTIYQIQLVVCGQFQRGEDDKITETSKIGDISCC